MSISKNIVHSVFEGSPADSVDRIGPGQTWIVNGLDWSWAYVKHSPFPGHHGYKVGTDGNIWSGRKQVAGSKSRRWTLLAPTTKQGYSSVRIYQSHHDWRDIKVHTVVLETFVGPAPEGMEGCHNPNPRRTDNRLSNLRWDTHKSNVRDGFNYREKNGIEHPANQRIGEASHYAKVTERSVLEIRQMACDGASNKEIEVRFRLGPTQVSRILNGHSWKHLDPDGVARVKAARAR